MDGEDMTVDERIERVVQRFDPRSMLLRAWEMQGGVSAQLTGLEVERPDGRTLKLVVRRSADYERNPQVADNEFKLLACLCAAGVPAPKPYLVDVSGEIFLTPYIVIQYIEGQQELSPDDLDGYIRQLVRQLTTIHAIDGAASFLPPLPHVERVVSHRLRASPTSLNDPIERDVWPTLQAIWPLPRRNRPVLLHGDYWPGNTLWRDGKLVAAIDWEDAKIGDPAADLAVSRLEMLWAFGSAAMERFTARYRSMTNVDLADLRYWDLAATLGPIAHMAEWGLDEEEERAMRDALHRFIQHALDAL